MQCANLQQKMIALVDRDLLYETSTASVFADMLVDAACNKACATTAASSRDLACCEQPLQRTCVPGGQHSVQASWSDKAGRLMPMPPARRLISHDAAVPTAHLRRRGTGRAPRRRRRTSRRPRAGLQPPSRRRRCERTARSCPSPTCARGPHAPRPRLWQQRHGVV